MFIIKSQRKRALKLDEPLKHGSHKRPVTRRDFLAQGFLTGSATLIAPTLLGSVLSSRAQAALSTDMQQVATQICNITAGRGKIPFICFDLAGGANIVGSNVLVGKEGGQMDFLSTQGYVKQGLAPTMLPNNATTNFVNTELGLAFHSDSAFLRGILEKTSATTRANINGCVIAARSENDTGNNPHNPMYGLAKAGPSGAGVKGELLTLIGSQNSESGGNSMAPAMMIDPVYRPTKVDRTSDVTGLVDTGELANLLSPADTVAVMESMARVSQSKLQLVNTQLTDDAEVKTRVRCGYVKTADTIDKFSSPAALNPAADPEITGATGVFGTSFANGRFTDGEFEKTAAVMKLVVEGYAGAGTISMGGFDYHTGERATGENRDLRAGRAMGACLEFAARRGKPLMLYVFSDGSLSSNGRLDMSVDGRGKGEWTGDNQQVAASFFLVYSPTGRPTLLNEGGISTARRQQIGYFNTGGDVVTASSPVANNVNLLVQSVLLNYMALHGERGSFASAFPTQGLGGAADGLVSMNPIVTANGSGSYTPI
jgi:hypothetical protein